MSRIKIIGFILLLGVAGAGYWYIDFYKAKIAAKPFTVVVLPDTQEYVRKYHGIFKKQTQWILDNRNELNIKFVAHMGDIVHNHNQIEKEWEEASESMALLEGVVPHSVLPGNHDMDYDFREDGLNMYNKYFPVSRYDKFSWYKGNRKENANSYQLITVQTVDKPLDLLFISLEIEPSDNDLAWANGIVKAHPDAYTIVSTHKYLSDKGKLDTKREYSREGNTGQEIWEKLIKKNCSIKMVLNGHYHAVDGEYTLVSRNSCDQDVYQIIQDYQEREVGGNGRLRYYTFDSASKTISAKTYSPHTGTFEEDEDSQFSIPFNY